MISKLSLIFFCCILSSCSSIYNVSSETRWTYNRQITTAPVDRITHIHWKIGNNEVNMSDCSHNGLYTLGDSLISYKGKLFVKSVAHDLPFHSDSLCFVYADRVMLFETNHPVNLAPDYVIQADSVVMGMNGEVYRPESQQRSNVVWRNIVVKRAKKRILCIDRFNLGGRNFALVYVMQSRGKQLRRWKISDWCDLPSWDCTNPHNIMLSAGLLEYWRDISVQILNNHYIAE